MPDRIHISILFIIFTLTGCAVQSPYDRSYVSEGITERTDYELGQVTEPGEFTIPEGVSLADGLSPDEAVALALWNNAQFQADLAALGFARADLIEAGMLSNPTFSLLFPVGPKLLESKLLLAVDDLWQRPSRVAAAQFDAQSLSENLIEHGLGLIRDVHSAYADLWLAREQLRLTEQDALMRAQVAELARARLGAGDISELVASAAYVDSLQAVDVTKHTAKEAIILNQRFCALVGLIPADTSLEILPLDIATPSAISIDELQETAFAARPDLRAAELAIEAAGKRLGWERTQIFNFIAILDAKDKGEPSLTTGPGFQIDVPLFNRRGGQIARAEAELEQAALLYQAVRQQIMLEVQEAQTQYVSSLEELELWRSDIIPSLEKAVEQAQRSFAVGEASYLLVLESMRKLLEVRTRMTELTANLYRSAAQLNYCVGKKVI